MTNHDELEVDATGWATDPGRSFTYGICDQDDAVTLTFDTDDQLVSKQFGVDGISDSRVASRP